MGEFTMPYELFEEEWLELRLRNPACGAVVLKLIDSLKEEDFSLEEITGECMEAGLSEEFIETVIISVIEPEEHKQYLELIRNGR